MIYSLYYNQTSQHLNLPLLHREQSVPNQDIAEENELPLQP